MCKLLLILKKAHLFSQSSSLWISYLSSAKDIINQFYIRDSFEEDDWDLLYQWVFYFDTLARLGIKHWRGNRPVHLQLEEPGNCFVKPSHLFKEVRFHFLREEVN